MNPPTAPASLLTSLRPSLLAPYSVHDIALDSFLSARLASVAVTLFRVGRGQDARMLAQYGVDLLGKGAWDSWVQEYLSSEEMPNSMAFMRLLLEEALGVLEPVEPGEAGRLVELVEAGIARVG